jgi:hypothetical protein
VKQKDINTFTIINSNENHYVIIDECGEMLRHCYCIKYELFRILKEMTTGN